MQARVAAASVVAMMAMPILDVGSALGAGHRQCRSYLGSIVCFVSDPGIYGGKTKRVSHVKRTTTSTARTAHSVSVISIVAPQVMPSTCTSVRVPCAPITPKAPAPTVTPAVLARQLMASMQLPKPTAKRSPDQTLPDGRPTTFVKLSTWFYVPVAQYKPKIVRAQVGAVWATATATPVALTFTPGDGTPTVACAGPGRAWVYGQDKNDTPPPGGCGYTYTRSSYGQPDGMVTATYGIQWEVTWVGSGGAGGALPSMQTTSTSRFAVAEAQAVVVAQ